MRHRFSLPAIIVSLCCTVLVSLSGCGTLNAIGGSNTSYFPPNLPRSTPTAAAFNGCPAQGKGGDPALNTLLNRTDDSPPQGYRQTDISTVMTVPTTTNITNVPRSQWTKDETSRVSLYEGAAVRTTGWVVATRELGPDPAHCGSSADRDWALWIGTGAGDALNTTLVVIVTPQIRAQRPGWTNYTMRRIVGQIVRISGYMVYDQIANPLVAANEATPWVIGPVMHMEAYYQSEWTNLDLIPFGQRISGTPQPGASS